MAASHLNKTVKICILLCGSFAIYNIIFGTPDDRKSEENTAKFRDLSLNLGNGDCKWQPPQYDTPEDIEFYKTLIVGYPSGDKRMTFLQMEALTGWSAKDEWDFEYLGMTNHPFIKANYPHHEGLWGWEDVADQTMLVVRNIRRSMVEYHDILWDIGYAQTWYEVSERLTNLYVTRPPIEDFLLWRDERVEDEILWYGWFIDYWMEAGLLRDVYTHKITTPEHWDMVQHTHSFKPHLVAYDIIVGDQEVTPAYDPHCTNGDVTDGCFPAVVVSAERLLELNRGPAENRKIAEALNHTGMAEYLIEEEAWECIWRELIINKKGARTYLDREGFGEREYNFSTQMLSGMLTELDRLITKYSSDEWYSKQQAKDLVDLLTEHRSVIADEYDDVSSGRRKLMDDDFLGREERNKRKLESIVKELTEELERTGMQKDDESISREARATWLKQEKEKQDYGDFFDKVEKKLFDNRKIKVKSEVYVEDMKRKQTDFEERFMNTNF